MQHDSMQIYRRIPRNKHFFVVCGRECSEKPPKKATNLSGIKNSKSFKEIRLSWYQSIDKTHFWLYVTFEAGSSIPFTRKMSSKKVRLFPRSELPSNGGG
jgi:hypothetical protein